MNRPLLTILTAGVAASLAAGCSTLDTDTVASVGDAELSNDELDELLEAQGVTDGATVEAARSAISTWIFETSVEQGLVSEEILADLPEERLTPAYDEGIEAAGIICPTIIVADSPEAGETAVERLASGDDVADVVAEFNIDPQLEDVGGRAGCFPLEQFQGQGEQPPEIEALFGLDAENPYASAEIPAADGSTDALVIGFRSFDELDEPEADQVVQALRQTVGLRLLVQDIDIDVASRYGTFDIDGGGVVPLG